MIYIIEPQKNKRTIYAQDCCRGWEYSCGIEHTCGGHCEGYEPCEEYGCPTYDPGGCGEPQHGCREYCVSYECSQPGGYHYVP